MKAFIYEYIIESMKSSDVIWILMQKFVEMW